MSRVKTSRVNYFDVTQFILCGSIFRILVCACTETFYCIVIVTMQNSYVYVVGGCSNTQSSLFSFSIPYDLVTIFVRR